MEGFGGWRHDSTWTQATELKAISFGFSLAKRIASAAGLITEVCGLITTEVHAISWIASISIPSWPTHLGTQRQLGVRRILSVLGVFLRSRLY